MTNSQQLVHVLNAGMDGLSVSECDPQALDNLIRLDLVYLWYSERFEDTFAHAFDHCKYFRSTIIH